MTFFLSLPPVSSALANNFSHFPSPFSACHAGYFEACVTTPFEAITEIKTQVRRSLVAGTFAPDVTQITVNTRTYKQSHTPTVVQGGGGGGLIEPLPWVFAVFQYFGEILPLVESL